MNKEIFVGMTHKEYEEYKKYLNIKNDCGSVRLSYSMGMGAYKYELGVFNETETISILNAQIEELREQNLTAYKEGRERERNEIELERKSNTKKWF